MFCKIKNYLDWALRNMRAGPLSKKKSAKPTQEKSSPAAVLGRGVEGGAKWGADTGCTQVPALALGWELGLGVQEGAPCTQSSSKHAKAGEDGGLSWRDEARLAELMVEKRDFDIYGKFICWCQTSAFIVRKKTNPTTETHPQLRIHTEGNDFPIKPVLLDINI